MRLVDRMMAEGTLIGQFRPNFRIAFVSAQTKTDSSQNYFLLPYSTRSRVPIESLGFSGFHLSAWKDWWAHQGSNLGPAD